MTHGSLTGLGLAVLRAGTALAGSPTLRLPTPVLAEVDVR
jgi:hypothetical protein